MEKLMNTSKNLPKQLGVLSLIGSLTSVLLMIAFALTVWGEPGTAAYQTYVLLNRLMAGALVMMAAGWLGLALRIPAGYGRWGGWLALVAALVMIAGNAAEFYLFSDQPYGFNNQRNAAWSAFSMGSLVLDIGATMAGIAIWRKRLWPRWIGTLLMLALPLDILAFFIFSPFLGPAVLALAVGWLQFSNPDQVVDPKGAVEQNGSGLFSMRDGQKAGGDR
jgi:hypothetical protein